MFVARHTIFLNTETIKEDSLRTLKKTIKTYRPISAETWEGSKHFVS